MCQYINIILPGEAKLKDVEPLLAKHELGFRPFHNTFVLHQLKKGVSLINTTSKQCDCGSVIASKAHPSNRNIQTKDIERLKRKGWSETKISNWTENKSKTNVRTKERDKEREQWTNFLEEAILKNKIGKVGLYIHWYDETMESEELTFAGREKISLVEMKSDTLDELNYDVLYEFIS